LDLRSGAWETISDPQPFPLSNDAGNSLTFDFPAAGSIYYLFTASPQLEIRGSLVVTVRTSATGPVVFNSLDPITPSCSIPASVRPLIWANNNGAGDYDRWWSNPRAARLADGGSTVTVPLSAESWSSVNGVVGDANGTSKLFFVKALKTVSRLGVTFGGGCSFGHGINVSGGDARFVLAEFGIR
jgi:hypothetical protein